MTEIVLPPFMKSVYKEVLKKMGIPYVVCQFESKQQCIALAQKLKCPIISNDVEFCFSGVPYIPSTTFQYDDSAKSINCGIFRYANFQNKYRLTKEKIAIFITLTNERVGFPESYFDQLFRDLKLPYSPFRRNEVLLRRLERMRPQDLLSKIFVYTDCENQKKFKEEVDKMIDFICRSESLGIPAKYLLDSKQVFIKENDPDWFEKGVVLGYISLSYSNMYNAGILQGSWLIQDFEADDAMLLSFDIIAYAYNLMTNFEKDEIVFVNKNGTLESKGVSTENAIIVQKPPYNAQSSPFENGWDDIKTLQLFEHFMTQSLHGINFNVLETIPEDAKLLILALVYFSRHKSDNTAREAYSILLSYVMLGVVFEKVDEKNNNHELKKKPILDPFTDPHLVTRADCNAANSILDEFFTLKPSELHEIFDRKLMHPFMEFQHCLNEINNLNKLCGMPFQPTVYHKTYNGTFVYKFFYSLKETPGEGTKSCIEDKLSPAPTVLAFLNGLIEVYEEVMYK